MLAIAPQLEKLYQPDAISDKHIKAVVEYEIEKFEKRMSSVFLGKKQSASGNLAKTLDVTYEIRGGRGEDKQITLFIKSEQLGKKKYAEAFQFGVKSSSFKTIPRSGSYKNGGKDEMISGISSWIKYKVKNGTWDGDIPKNDEHVRRLAFAIARKIRTYGLHTSMPSDAESIEFSKNKFHQKPKKIGNRYYFMYQYILTRILININRTLMRINKGEINVTKEGRVLADTLALTKKRATKIYHNVKTVNKNRIANAEANVAKMNKTKQEIEAEIKELSTLVSALDELKLVMNRFSSISKAKMTGKLHNLGMRGKRITKEGFDKRKEILEKSAQLVSKLAKPNDKIMETLNYELDYLNKLKYNSKNSAERLLFTIDSITKGLDSALRVYRKGKRK